MDDEQIHVLMTHDGVRRLAHDDDGGLHDSFGERCNERNGDVICEACRGPDGEVECGGTCPWEADRRLNGVLGVDVSEGRARGAGSEWGMHGLEQENVLVGYGGDQSPGQQNVLGVHGDVQVPAHSHEMVWKFCVRWHEIDGRHWIDER